jgi:uncharacterized membrane protein YdfJ with MMPL/SSD domain
MGTHPRRTEQSQGAHGRRVERWRKWAIIGLVALTVVLALAATAALGILSGTSASKTPPDASIDTFEDCVRAGYPVAESYPEQCFTPDGRGFTRPLPAGGSS